MTTMTMMEREFSPLEQWYELSARFGIAAIATAFELRGGRIATDALSAAVSSAAARCPVLFSDVRACPAPQQTLFAWWKRDPPFVSPRALFSLCEEEERGGVVVEQFIEREIARRFDVFDSDAPRLFVSILRSGVRNGDGDWLVLASHHLFFDGRGLVSLAASILAALDNPSSQQQQQQQQQQQHEAVSFPPADYDMTLRLWDVVCPGEPLPPPLFTAGPQGRKVMLPPKVAAGSAAGEPQAPGLVSFSLTEAETAAFLAGCKRHGVSATSAFVAAFGVALRAVGGTGGSFVPSTPVDMRLLLPDSTPEDRAMRASTCNGIGSIVDELSLEGSLEDIALRHKQFYGRGLACRDPHLTRHVANWTFMRQWQAANPCTAWPYSSDLSAAVSNMGPLESAGLAGSRCRVRRVLSSAFGGGGWAFVASSCSGILSASLSFATPMFSRSTADSMAASIRESLLHFAFSPKS